MDKLVEFTLQQQLAEIRTENADVRAQVAELATLLKQQLQLVPIQPAGAPSAPTINIGSMSNTTNNTQVTQVTQNIVIQPWDGDKRISVNVGQIAAAFAENARLKEYARLADHELADPEIAPPYVTELLVDLVKRAHADPAARNIYLNPRRADQVLVHLQSGRWEVVSLQDATRLMFDGVVKATVGVTMSNEERRQLPLEAQNALAMAGLLYDDEPDEYASRARGPMAAHLANCRDATPDDKALACS